jgi:hypothetical protein
MTKAKKSKVKTPTVPASAENRTKMSYRSSKHRARKFGMPWEFDDYQDFHKHLGDRPSDEHTLDRIDNAKGYVKGNLRWATKKEQAENRSTTIKINYKGKTLTAWEFAQELGVSVDFVYGGLRRGESPEAIAFLAREASAHKTVPEPWPWPEDRAVDWEQAYLRRRRHEQSRESFYYEQTKANVQKQTRIMNRYAEDWGGPSHPDDEAVPPPEMQEAAARYRRATWLFWDAKEKYEQAIARKRARDDLNLFD